MSELRIGVVGLGWVAGAHIETFKSVQGAKVTAVCSRRPQNPAELQARYGQPLKAFASLDEMLPHVDVVDICTPHPLHAQQAIAAAKAGKHLIIEKPLCLSWADALAIRDAIRAAKVKACVCFEVRFSAQASLAKSVLEQGLLGDIHYGEVDYFHGIGPWYKQYEWNIKREFGGSSLLTAGCHALDTLLFLMDEPVEEVSSYSTKSRSETFAAYEYDTTSTSLLRFKSGRVGKVASSIDCIQPYYFRMQLTGSAGSLLDNKIHSSRIAGLSKSAWSTLNVPLVDSGDVKDHPYQPQFQAFVDCVSRNEAMPRTDFDTALETHRVLFAADRSAAERRPVRISEFSL